MSASPHHPAHRFATALITSPILLLNALAALALPPPTAPTTHPSAKQSIRQALHQQHALPYLFERQTLIVTDRHGRSHSRQLEYYQRLNPNAQAPDCQACYLIKITAPPATQGIRLLARYSHPSSSRKGPKHTHQKTPSGKLDAWLYLPGQQRRYRLTPKTPAMTTANTLNSHFLDSDFHISDLLPENPDNWNYQRLPSSQSSAANKAPNHPIRILATDKQQQRPARVHILSGQPPRLSQTEFLDNNGQIQRRIHYHDSQTITLPGTTLQYQRPNSILIETMARQTSGPAKVQSHSQIQIQQRLIAHDLVPPEQFDQSLLKQTHAKPPQ